MSEYSYRLLFTPKAEEDLDEIYKYIFGVLSNATAADKLADDIEKAVMRLMKYPFSGQYVLDEPLKTRGYRKLNVDNYLFFYLVNEVEEQIIIMRILFGARKYQEFL